MPFLLLTKVLDSVPAVKREGALYLLPEELDAAAFVSLGQEVLQIPRVGRVEVGADLVVFTTHKSERFFFPPEQVMGFKYGGPEAKAFKPNAGFTK
jgi:hypothetical protein